MAELAQVALAQRLVSCDDRSAGDGDILIGSDRIERVAGAEHHAAFGELRAIERGAQSDAVDLADSFGRHHRHDRVGQGDGQDPLRILGRETRDVLRGAGGPRGMPRAQSKNRLREGDRRAVRDGVGCRADAGADQALLSDQHVLRDVGATVKRRKAAGQRLAPLTFAALDLVERDAQIGRARAQSRKSLVPRRHDVGRWSDGHEHLVILDERRRDRSRGWRNRGSDGSCGRLG